MIYYIYKISIKDYVYIGSTKDFNQRKINHKRACNNLNLKESKFKVYEIIRQNGGWDECEIVPIDEIECETKIQALIHEEKLRLQYKANMNSFAAHRVGKEKENEQKREKVICECGVSYGKSNSTHHFRTQKHLDFITLKKNLEILILPCVCLVCGK